MVTISGQYYKTFLGVIYKTGSVFLYDFDWGYTDNDIITLKKVLYNAIKHFCRWFTNFWVIVIA
jgi:hypothetical protein